MKKKYTIEVPLNSHPIKSLAKLNNNNNIQIYLYGGYPDSPLNGGRFNYTLDNIVIWSKLLFRISKKQLNKVREKFFQNIEQANKNNIPFLLAYTNMFVDDNELNNDNLAPIEKMIELAKQYNVKNGIIVNNIKLDKFLRDKYGDKLVYFSSCTKYVTKDKILSSTETLKLYKADLPKYDYVVLTPQDSRKADLINKFNADEKTKIIAISNSYCSNACNAYQHYEFTSIENKTSLTKVNDFKILSRTMKFAKQQRKVCSATKLAFKKLKIKEIIEMQIKAGIKNFKLGRGYGTEALNELVKLLSSSTLD